MIQIPDNVRPTLDVVIKHHFWLLLGLVPLVVLPMLFIARGRLVSEIDAARGQVESRLSAIRGVEAIQPHPNEAWSGEIDKVTQRVKRETLAEWQRLWTSQQPLRVWPALLGADFVQRVTTLKPGSKLPRPLLERYQTAVLPLVRALPARMGAAEHMVEAGSGQASGPPGMMEPVPGGARPGLPGRPTSLVEWNSADQQRLFASFNRPKPPSTLEVLLAQEELWVYGLLADAIARANQTSAGAYNAAIPLVEMLAVGYPAAEDNPGGAAGGRIIVPKPAGQTDPMGEFGGGMPPMMEGGAAPGGATARPPHPRFGGPSAGMGSPGGEAPPDPAASPDDLLRNWIYVDFTGKPLLAAEVAASPDAKVSHLMPFLIRAVVDDRKLDAFLVDLATAPVPIDVRQVRIRSGGSGAGPSMSPMGGGGEFAGPGGQVPQGSRPHDVTVELRGTVALATPPDPVVLGLEVGADREPEAGVPDAGGVNAGVVEPRPVQGQPEAAAENAQGNQP